MYLEKFEGEIVQQNRVGDSNAHFGPDEHCCRTSTFTLKFIFWFERNNNITEKNFKLSLKCKKYLQPCLRKSKSNQIVSWRQI